MRYSIARCGFVVGILLIAAACAADPVTSAPRTTSAPTGGTSESTIVDVAPPVAIGGADFGIDMNDVQGQLPAPTPTADLPTNVGDLEIWGQKSIELPDGRALILGRWSGDETIETSTRPLSADGLGEVVTRNDIPIRLFVVDWETETFAAISDPPETHVFSNATGEHLFAEIVLEFQLEPDGQTVRYSSGWNGAGYDFPYSLWLAEIPAA